MKRGAPTLRRLSLTLCAIVVAMPVFSAEPRTFSPGAPDRMIEVNGECPTFRWETVPDAHGWEFIVYEVDPGVVPGNFDPAAEPPEIYLHLPREATSWKSTAGDCLRDQRGYVWFVRAIGVDDEGQEIDAGAWSPARYFRVNLAPPHDLHTDGPGDIQNENPSEFNDSTASVDVSHRVFPDTGYGMMTSSSLPKGVDIGSPTAVKGVIMDGSGEVYGLMGIVLSPDGAAIAAVNPTAGPDIVLNGGGEPNTSIRESGIDRPSPSDQSFDITNSGGGGMSLQVQGVAVVTTATDKDSLGALSCTSGQIAGWTGSAWVCIDETRRPASLFGVFGGDGSNGSWTVDYSTVMNSHRLQFTDFTVPAGSTYTVRPLGAGYIAVQGRCTIAGEISADGVVYNGAVAQTTVGSGTPGSNASRTRADSSSIPFAVTGAGGAGGRGGAMECGGSGGGADSYGGYGCASGDAGTGSQFKRISGGTLNSGDGTTTTDGFASLLFGVGGGGGSGGLATEGGSGGAGGNSGGVIYIECGELDLSGVVSARGANGEDGIGDAGGGGGGGGGVVLIRTRNIVNFSGFISTAGGDGGTGSGTGNDGGTGADGFWDVVVFP